MNLETFPFLWWRLPYLQQHRPSESVPHIGERTIEIPIAREYLRDIENLPGFGWEKVLEVGAVMPYYIHAAEQAHSPRHVPWRVVDPYDPFVECERTDAEDIDYRGLHVLSISTIEHVGTGEYGDRDPDPPKAVRVLTRILQDAASYLVSWPVGHNEALDRYAELGRSHPCFMFHQREGNRWKQIPETWDHEYGRPYPYGNAVVFFAGTNQVERQTKTGGM